MIAHSFGKTPGVGVPLSNFEVPRRGATETSAIRRSVIPLPVRRREGNGANLFGSQSDRAEGGKSQVKFQVKQASSK